MKNVVHYLNMKMPDILVEIIDLQLCSSLKWDGVYTKGVSWAGPHHIDLYRWRAWRIQVMGLNSFRLFQSGICYRRQHLYWGFTILSYLRQTYGLWLQNNGAAASNTYGCIKQFQCHFHWRFGCRKIFCSSVAVSMLKYIYNKHITHVINCRVYFMYR